MVHLTSKEWWSKFVYKENTFSNLPRKQVLILKLRLQSLCNTTENKSHNYFINLGKNTTDSIFYIVLFTRKYLVFDAWFLELSTTMPLIQYIVQHVLGYLVSKLFKLLRCRESVQVNLHVMTHHVHLYSRQDQASIAMIA